MRDQGSLMNQERTEFFKNESGAVAVIAAIGMAVFLGFAAFALDIAHMVSVKRDLAKAAEAGALSGARGLWPQNLTTAAGRLPDCANAESWARTTAMENKVANTNLSADEVMVEVGRWDYTTKKFTPGNSSSANSVQVTTYKANVQMMFAPIFGINSKDMSRTAIAVMDFAKAMGPGCLPIAVNQDYSQCPGKTISIGFNPDPEDNGGWFSKDPDSASASTFKDYINNGSCPQLNIGDTINLQNGVDASVLHLLKAQLALHPDGLETYLPVVDTPKFNHSDQIGAFVHVLITEVKDTGNPKYVKGTVLPLGQIASGLPGGGNQGGALAPPKLVQ
jgi:Flp pilus assembly protein TadG